MGAVIIGNVAIKIMHLLQENKNYEILVEGKNWYARTNCSGNLPKFIDESKPLAISSDGKKVLGLKAWVDKNSIKEIVIPNGITEINDSTFQNCENLVSVGFPNGVTKIGEFAFKNCKNLVSVELPNTTKEIGMYAFSNCESLETIILPNSVNMEVCSFQNCKVLKNISSKKYFIKDVFLISDGKINSVLNTELEKYIIPENIGDISDCVGGCYDMKELIIKTPTKIDIIDFEKEFFFIENLKSITCPKSIKLKNLPTSVRVIRT